MMTGSFPSLKNVNAIFQQPWWLEALTPGKWGVVDIKNGEEQLARLPYAIARRNGLTLLTMPPLTQTLGPWLRPSTAKYANRLSQEKELFTQLIDALPAHDLFSQNLHHSVTNWLPFYWKHFEQTTRYTYVLEDLSDLDEVWSAFRGNIRTEIRKAEKQLVVSTDRDLDTFLNVNDLTFRRQGKPAPYNHGTVHRLDAACKSRNSRRIFFAEDPSGRVHAAVYVVWDERSAFYLMGGSDPELRNSGAMSLALWHAIKHAATVTEKFDFEGSMSEPIEYYVRGFGARQIPYSRVSRMNRRMKVLTAGRDFYRALRSGDKC